MQTDRLRLAIDIGGTFTDTVLMRGDDELVATTKTLTTPENPALGALSGARRLWEKTSIRPEQISGFIHGTTLATNALIERRGAKVATITTAGFRDILEIAYERRYAQYDIDLQKPDLLVPRSRSFTVTERLGPNGEVLIPLNEGEVESLLSALEPCNAKAVAICLLHSYANPAHEQRLRDLLLAARPDLTISISSEISPEAREFDRLCTTVANAYIQPLMQSYLSDFQQAFTKAGLRCPVLMMTAGGGMCTLETAKSLPVRLVESGPAGGAILAAKVAQEIGANEVLSLDIGGTTAKLCLIDQGAPQMSRQFEIARAARFIKGSGMPVRIPVIEMIEIGAGGGSIAAVDHLGRLCVGPQSAGSVPGPVAFGQGGTEPTVTDSDLMLGYLRAETFAEGFVSLDAKATAAALAAKIGAPLDLDAIGAADGISRIVDESMASAARMHAVESGKDLGERVMIAFGGNGPLHATRVARSCGVRRIVVPPDPGVGSAVGFLFAPISFEIVRSHFTTLQQLDFQAINNRLVEMTKEAIEVVKKGAGDAAITTSLSAFMRYAGQGHEIEIALPNHPMGENDLAPLQAVFEREYSRQFSRPVPGMEIEILNWAVRGTTTVHRAFAEGRPLRSKGHNPKERCEIICDLSGKPTSAGLIWRADLQPGDYLSGPALVVEDQTTTLVSADFDMQVDQRFNLVLSQREEGAAG